MSFSEIVKKPLNRWTTADLENVCHLKVEESRTVEFKQDLGKQNSGKNWRKKGELQPGERDDLAKEIVALANTYGGIIVVGIVETKGKPNRAQSLAEPLPRIFDLADRLGDALAVRIDPPLRLLELQAVPLEDGADKGFLVIRVPASTSAPHGYGNPPMCFVRHNDKSTPMIMRDIQNLFWETRTKRERIEKELKSRSDQFQSFVSEVPHSRFVATRFTAVFEHSVSMTNLYDDLSTERIFQKAQHAIHREYHQYAIWPFNHVDWTPEPNGAQLSFEATNDVFGISGWWELDEIGVASFVGEMHGRTIGDLDGRVIDEYSPRSICQVAGWLIKLARSTLDFANEPNISLIADGEIKTGPGDVQILGGPRNFNTQESKVIRPIKVDLPNAAEQLRLFEQKIWSCFGMSKQNLQDVVINSMLDDEFGRSQN